jgi:hypothetical protein
MCWYVLGVAGLRHRAIGTIRWLTPPARSPALPSARSNHRRAHRARIAEDALRLSRMNVPKKCIWSNDLPAKR